MSSSSAPRRSFVYVLNGVLKWSTYLPTNHNIASNAKFESITTAAIMNACPNGAYTGMLVRNLSHALCFQAQMQRVCKNIMTMTSSLEALTHAERIHAVQRLVLPSLQTALRTLSTEPNESDTSSKQLHTRMLQEKVKVVIITAPSSSSEHADSKQIDVHVMVDMTPITNLTLEQCSVEVRLGHRSDPSFKKVAWAIQRRALEAKCDAKNNEVVLCDEQARLYEGLQSNFVCVVADKKSPTGFRLVTTPQEDVLRGTVFTEIEVVCEEQQIPIEFTHPAVKDARTWLGCFLASTSRTILPIGRLEIYADASDADLLTDRVEYAEIHPLLSQLRSDVRKALDDKAVNVMEL